ncbi:hypothetical protein ABUE31_15775 [Mesorhizobium sp. ZMM04-5]|uniref:DUF2214 domain-containing protein n=1 Tax=Mesorhizobium marinum TaxID=3228790 RepID=A0ABV3R3V5_9HYPH
MEFLQAIEQAEPVRLLKTSFLAYPVVNALHIAAIGVLFASIVLMDLCVLGAIRTAQCDPLVALLRRAALAAFPVAVLTGASLFSIQATTYVRNPAFQVKLVLIALAGANALTFMVLDRGRSSQAWPRLRRMLALASILLWSAVLLCGRLIGFV